MEANMWASGGEIVNRKAQNTTRTVMLPLLIQMVFGASRTNYTTEALDIFEKEVHCVGGVFAVTNPTFWLNPLP